MTVGQFRLDGAARQRLVTRRRSRRRRQRERNESRLNRQGGCTLFVPGLAPPAEEERWRQTMATRHGETEAVVLSASARIARLSSRVHERRVPATTIWGEIVGPDIGRIQAFATALYPSPGSHRTRRPSASAYTPLTPVMFAAHPKN